MAIGFMKRMSPEYVVEKALEDIKKTGLDGLKPYLTSGGKKKFETLTMVSSGVGLISGIFTSQSGQKNESGNAVIFLRDHVKDCVWTVKDIMKGSETAKGIIGFKYEDKMEGTLELSLVKEEKEWKIDNMEMPKFDKFNV